MESINCLGASNEQFVIILLSCIQSYYPDIILCLGILCAYVKMHSLSCLKLSIIFHVIFRLCTNSIHNFIALYNSSHWLCSSSSHRSHISRAWNNNQPLGVDLYNSHYDLTYVGKPCYSLAHIFTTFLASVSNIFIWCWHVSEYSLALTWSVVSIT